jgi:hypothetical protein
MEILMAWLEDSFIFFIHSMDRLGEGSTEAELSLIKIIGWN